MEWSAWMLTRGKGKGGLGWAKAGSFRLDQLAVSLVACRHHSTGEFRLASGVLVRGRLEHLDVLSWLLSARYKLWDGWCTYCCSRYLRV